MPATAVCPHCGTVSLQVRQIEIREVELDRLSWKPTQKLTELECKECGWLDTKPASAATETEKPA